VTESEIEINAKKARQDVAYIRHISEVMHSRGIEAPRLNEIALAYEEMAAENAKLRAQLAEKQEIITIPAFKL
jgi:hypothetical protein